MSKTFETLTPDEFEIEARKQADKIVSLLRRKRESYGPGNLTRFGETGIIIRMGDKFQRLENHVEKIVATGEGNEIHADGESLEDAFMDIIGYSFLALIYRASPA